MAADPAHPADPASPEPPEPMPARPDPWTLLTSFSTPGPRWPGALRAALALALPGAAALLLGFDNEMLLIAAGGFTVIYGEGHPYRTRWRVMAVAGGLIALAATGIRVPEEMRVATLANRGLGPVWFKPLTRLEYDPVGNARLIGGYVLAILDGKDVPPPRLNMAFIPGET